MAEKHRSRSVARQLLTMDDVILSERKELHLYFNHEQDGSGRDTHTCYSQIGRRRKGRRVIM